MKHIILLLSVIALAACTNKAAYDAIKHNQCLEKTGKIHCDEIEGYEDYKQKRDELLKS
ncbi:MAG: hypothetical protein JXR04_12140 [Bermanella sp.]